MAPNGIRTERKPCIGSILDIIVNAQITWQWNNFCWKLILQLNTNSWNLLHIRPRNISALRYLKWDLVPVLGGNSSPILTRNHKMMDSSFKIDTSLELIPDAMNVVWQELTRQDQRKVLATTHNIQYHFKDLCSVYLYKKDLCFCGRTLTINCWPLAVSVMSYMGMLVNKFCWTGLLRCSWCTASVFSVDPLLQLRWARAHILV